MLKRVDLRRANPSGCSLPIPPRQGRALAVVAAWAGLLVPAWAGGAVLAWVGGAVLAWVGGAVLAL
jgi:hypothetical protein